MTMSLEDMKCAAGRLHALAAGPGAPVGGADVDEINNGETVHASDHGKPWVDCWVHVRLDDTGECSVDIRGLSYISGTVENVEKIINLIPDDMKPYPIFQPMSRFAQLAKFLSHNPPIDTSTERAKAARSLDQALADDLESIRYAAEEHAANRIASDVSTAAFVMFEAWLKHIIREQ